MDNMGEQIKKILRENHTKNMADPVYKDGFESPYHAVNPCSFPSGLNDKLLAISTKSGLLTEQEKDDLKKLNEEFFTTQWSRWSRGHWYNIKSKEPK